MKSFLLSDNHDTWVGMRLAGIDGVILHEREEVLETFKAATKNLI
nr:V-type ATP synthase subunit F [Cellulosilyticum ruminicola]